MNQNDLGGAFPAATHLICQKCRPTSVCPKHVDQYPAGPPKCAGCETPLDPILWPSGVHIGCTKPVPVRQPAIQPDLFAAPGGQIGKTHPLKGELVGLIRSVAADSPRSLQRSIGPSEIGADCMRRLAYRLAGIPRANTTSDPWFSIIGTAVHDWLSVATIHANEKLGRIRWVAEERVTATASGSEVTGSCDLYDVDTQTVIDWKVVGASSLRQYQEKGPSAQYRTQVHTYGLGHSQSGRPVREVAIVFLPRSGYLSDTHVWAETYDPTIAEKAITRLASIQQLAIALPAALIPASPDKTLCCWCPYFRPGGAADDTGCPGPNS